MSTSKNSLKIADFQIIRPAFESAQADGFDWLAAAHALSEMKHGKSHDFDHTRFSKTIRKLFDRFGCGPQRIAKRGHALSDFSHRHWDEMKIFRLNESAEGLGMKARMEFYSHVVDSIFEDFYKIENEKQPPNDLLHVTCTGYVSPSGAQKIVEKKGWQRNTTVTHAYHMGCYASVPALRMARGFLFARQHDGIKNPSADIVHTELCTLHMNPKLHDPEQLVVQGLFADGFIKYSMSFEENKTGPSLKVLALREETVPNSLDAMSWVCSDWGMQMGLSKDVPTLIAKHLKNFVESLFQDAGRDQKDKNIIFYAIHPGGPKIIDGVQEILEIEENKLSHSRAVLFNYGNMSSATLPHIWERLINDKSIAEGSLIVSLAFGPGLTICGALFEKCL